MTDRPAMNLAEVARTALATHGIEVACPLDGVPNRPHVLSDFATVAVKLHASYDDAWREVYWTRILGDGGVPVAPLLSDAVVRIPGSFSVVTRHLAPDRETDERDASAAGRIVRRVHDIAAEYAEPDGAFWAPCDLQHRNFVLYEGSLHLVGLGNVERHDRASARRRAARDFTTGLRADARELASAQFLSAYDAARP